jgi:thiol:disulfide interchange protein DsbD
MMNSLCKFVFLFVFSFFFAGTVFSQGDSPVFPWKVSSKKISDGQYELTFSTLAAGQWELYAPVQKIDLPTTELQFNDSSVVQEGTFSEKGVAKEIKHPLFEEGLVKVSSSPAEWTARIRFTDKDSVPAQLQGKLLYTYGRAADSSFYPSTEFLFTVAMEGGIKSAARIRIASIDIHNPRTPCGDDGTKNKSILSVFLLGVLGGLIALLTPCVFPMIPVTVTFFTKRSTNRKRGITNAVLYGFFIFLIYCLITVPFHIASKTISPEIFNNISTNVVLNFIFFAVFVLFALSFFGLFEIGLPSGPGKQG